MKRKKQRWFVWRLDKYEVLYNEPWERTAHRHFLAAENNVAMSNGWDTWRKINDKITIDDIEEGSTF